VAYTSEIEKLEQRFAENRRGRTFAPLADAYRKAGLIDNAIELCQEGLKVHPDYVSAWIVYGRCLLDKKDDPAAHEVYEKVLGLDPENVLALKTLAEIAERSNRPDEAAGWLNRLLSADPMNGEAAEALARARGKAAAAAPAPPAGRPSAAPSPPAPDGIEIERASGETNASVPAPATSSLELEPSDAVLDIDADAHRAAKADGLEVQEEVDLKPDAIHVEGLARTQYEGSGMFQLDHLPTPSEPESQRDAEDAAGAIDLPLIMPEELDAAAARRAPAPPPAPRPPPPPPPRPEAAPVKARLADDDGAADRAALSQVAPVVTETMAELYLRQGHKEDALRVYRALAAQRPGDERLQSRIDSLAGTKPRGASSGQSAGAFLKSLLHPGHSPGPAQGGVSDLVAGAFANAGEVPGEPTKPAVDSISLDAVFGDSDGQGKSAIPAPAAEPAPNPPAPAEPEKGFSFDEFFNNAAGGGAPAPQGGRTSGRHSRPPTDDPSEVDQFQAWLKKLKS
jgi:tetratricopeptide (TPR) repeat protein